MKNKKISVFCMKALLDLEIACFIILRGNAAIP